MWQVSFGFGRPSTQNRRVLLLLRIVVSGLPKTPNSHCIIETFYNICAYNDCFALAVAVISIIESIKIKGGENEAIG